MYRGLSLDDIEDELYPDTPPTRARTVDNPRRAKDPKHKAQRHDAVRIRRRFVENIRDAAGQPDETDPVL